MSHEVNQAIYDLAYWQHRAEQAEAIARTVQAQRDAAEAIDQQDATIYILVGSAGEYDDWRDWLVVAYRDEILAKVHAQNANQESARIGRALDELDQGDWETYREKRDALIKSNAYDPDMQDNYPRAGYDVYPLMLAVALPKASTL